ncbi:PAS domain-containing protein [Bradyrhizobium sp. USDA 4486]
MTPDITERQQAHSDLLESERRYRRLVEAVVDYASFQLDPSGNVATWNPGAERIKGYRPEEIIGRHFSTFYTPEDLERGVPKAALAEATEKGRSKPRAGACARTERLLGIGRHRSNYGREWRDHRLCESHA